MRSSIQASAAIVGFLGVGFLCGMDHLRSETPTDPDVLSNQIQSSDATERNKAHQMLTRQHELLISNLLQLARRESTTPNDSTMPRRDPLSDSYWRATRLLTTWRTRDVIPILVRDIERRPSVILTEGDNSDDLVLYPNAQALRRLAHTCVTREILHHLNLYHSEDVSDRAIELYAILLASPVVGETRDWIAYLEPIIKRSREESKNKANFDRLLVQLEKLKRGERPRF